MKKLTINELRLAPKGRIENVESLPNDGLEFVSDSQDVQFIREYFGHIASDYDSFFVEIGEGEYIQVWGMFGIVPVLDKRVTKVF